MNREQTIDMFYEQYYKPKWQEETVKLDRLAREQRPALVEKIKTALTEFLNQIRFSQHKGEKGPILCIGIHILRTEVLLRRYRFLLCAYDKKFLFDNNPMTMHMEAEEFFQPIADTHTFLDHNNKFRGSVKDNDINRMLQLSVASFQSYMTELFRLAVKLLAEEQCFETITKAENFFIICGEYKDTFDEIYITEKETRSADSIQAIIEDIEIGKESLECKVFENYRFNKIYLRERNLSKSRFIKSSFLTSNLNRAYLLKTEFSHCQFESTTFKSALLFDAYFDGCHFQNCDFSSAVAFITTPEMGLETVLGFTGASFQNSTFTDTLFTDANFSGADFRDAEFKNVSFEETILENAIFTKDAIPHLDLTQKQLDSIQII